MGLARIIDLPGLNKSAPKLETPQDYDARRVDRIENKAAVKEQYSGDKGRNYIPELRRAKESLNEKYSRSYGSAKASAPEQRRSAEASKSSNTGSSDSRKKSGSRGRGATTLNSGMKKNLLGQ